MGISELLVDLIENSFTFYLYDNATFYAERLYYENPTNDHLNILAQCYFRQNKIKQVYLLLKNVDNSISRYLFSLACLSLKKFEEAEASLLFHQESNSSPKIVPGGAAGLYLLGVICRKGHRKEKAINYFQESLKV
jgi:anaphase-promoting complex subunit 3